MLMARAASTFSLRILISSLDESLWCDFFDDDDEDDDDEPLLLLLFDMVVPERHPHREIEREGYWDRDTPQRRTGGIPNAA